MKKNALISSILTIALCVSLIAGSTFALFTGKDSIDVSVSSARVDVSAVVADLKLFSFEREQANGTFENRGTATYDEESGKLTMQNVAPGDKVTFNIKVTNTSTIDVQYRVRWSVNGELMDALIAKADGNKLENNVTPWQEWKIPAGGSETKTIPVSVELPGEITNIYQEMSAEMTFVVEAIQGNGIDLVLLNGVKYDSAEQALAAAVDGDTIDLYGAQPPLKIEKNVNVVLHNVEIYASQYLGATNAITISTPTTGGVSAVSAMAEIAEGVTLTLKGNNYLTGAKGGSAIYVEEGETLNLTGDSLVAIGNNGYEYFRYAKNGVEYGESLSNTTDATYAGLGGSGIGGEGAINITNVKSLTAEGYGVAGFGIGGSTESVTITDSTVEYARGGFVCANFFIPDWHDHFYGKKEPEGAPAIGSSKDGADITIKNSTVKMAEGGSKGAGIGARYHTGVNILIENSNVTAQGGNASAGIGGSRVASSADLVNDVINVTIKKSKIDATGGDYAAGIGSGYDTYGHSPETAPMNNVTIDAESDIIAKGGWLGAGIGTGHNVINFKGNIACDATNVKAGDGVDDCCEAPCTVTSDVGLGSLKTTAPGFVNVGFASNAEDITAAINAGKTNLILAAGEYVLPNDLKGKTVTITGTKDVKVKTPHQGEDGCNYAFDGSTVVLNGITIDTTGNTNNYPGYARAKVTYNNCVINGTLTTYDNSVFNGCTFNASGDTYNLKTWGAPKVEVNNCTFNSDGKALLLYGTANTKLTLNNCTFNDKGGLTDKKAAVEIGNDYDKSYELIVNNTVVNGYEINDNGTNTGTTLWGNKNSMGTDKLNVVVDGVDVY